MEPNTDRIERLAGRLHALDRNALAQPKADALVRVAEVLMRQDASFCLDFAGELERLHPPPAQALRLTTQPA